MPRKPTGARSRNQSRENNPNWRGGRSLASNGYVLIRVGTDHHLADVRGYAYEHRLVAEQKLGRRLLSGEIVHHVNECKTDNRPENLQVVHGNAEHFFHHRTNDSLRMPGEDNPTVPCECGCGSMIERYDQAGRPRRFISGHNNQSSGLSNAIRYFIAHVPVPSTTDNIIEHLGDPRPSVLNALRKLKAKGDVAFDGHYWSIAQ